MSTKASISQGAPSPAAARRHAARGAILAATHAVVAERGFSDTQISHIAHQAGVAVGSIYKHFPSRNELFAELYADTVTRELAVLEDVAGRSDGTALERLTLAIETFSSRALRGGRFALALLVEPTEPFLDELRLTYRARYRAFYAGLIEEARQDGRVEVGNAGVAAAALLGIMTEVLTMPRTESTPRLRNDAVVEAVLDTCLAALRAH